MNSELPDSCLYPNDAFLIFNSNRPNHIQPFIFDLHLQYRLKRKQNILLILLLNDWEHTSSVAAKLGLNLTMFKQNKLLDYVDIFDIMKINQSLEIDWKMLRDSIIDKVSSLPENSVVMIDDLSLFYIIHPYPNNVYFLIDEILKILFKKNCSALIASLVETGDERIHAHTEVLKNQCDVWIDCGKANSGFSQNFDGIIKCTDNRTNSLICANYKLQARSVAFSNI